MPGETCRCVSAEHRQCWACVPDPSPHCRSMVGGPAFGRAYHGAVRDSAGCDGGSARQSSCHAPKRFCFVQQVSVGLRTCASTRRFQRCCWPAVVACPTATSSTVRVGPFAAMTGDRDSCTRQLRPLGQWRLSPAFPAGTYLCPSGAGKRICAARSRRRVWRPAGAREGSVTGHISASCALAL